MRVFPTRVGVDRIIPVHMYGAMGFPHTRGGGPVPDDDILIIHEFSPHAWGWTVSQRASKPIPIVFPTRVGVDL